MLSNRRRMKQVFEMIGMPGLSGWVSWHKAILQGDTLIEQVSSEIIHPMGLNHWFDRLGNHKVEKANIAYTLASLVYKLKQKQKDNDFIKTWLSQPNDLLKQNIPLELIKSSFTSTYVFTAVERLE